MTHTITVTVTTKNAGPHMDEDEKLRAALILALVEDHVQKIKVLSYVLDVDVR